MESKKAVALRYDEDLPAPFIAAKGRGYIAERLLKIAEEHGVPISADYVLSDVLFVLEPGQTIPEELYEVVARLYAFVMRLQD
ncbi:MAG: EscU/YscU/HrcU family type III secretion system export apparatus switch protein [Spirochaetia bacterium]